MLRSGSAVRNRGISKEITFRSGERVEDVEVYEMPVTYLYKDNNEFIFMNNENYEQYHVGEELCEELEKFVIPNTEMSLNILENKVLSVNVPNFVVLKVAKAEPGVKGDTGNKSHKTD